MDSRRTRRHLRPRSLRPGSRLLSVCLILLVIGTGPALAQSGWFSQTSPVHVDLTDVDLRDAGTGWISGAQGTLLHTTDGGSHWLQQTSGTSYGLRGISFIDGGLGLAVGEGGTLLRTTNGGASWAVIRTDWMDTFHGVHLVDSRFACAVGVNAIFAPWAATSTDGGVSWAFHTFYIQSNEGGLTGVRFLDDRTGFASAYLWDGRGAVVKTTDGGDSWFPIVVVAYALYSIDFPDAQTGFACGLNGSVMKTTNGGVNWQLHFTGSGRTGLGLSFPIPSTGWVVGEQGGIVRTSDGGSSWTQQPGGTFADLHATAFVDPWIGSAVGAGGVILRTLTGGLGAGGVADPFRVDGDVGGEVCLLVRAASPNPFRGSTTTAYRLAHPAFVRIEIADPLGRRVRSLSPGMLPAGWHAWSWNGEGEAGSTVPSGPYFCRIRAGDTEATGRLLYLGR